MKNLLKYSLPLFAINALLFIYYYQNNYFWDDFEHLLDVKTYLKFGINTKSLLLHGNESGILTYWFWAILGNIFGDNLTVYRLGNFSVLMLSIGILLKIAFKNKTIEKPIYFSILFFLSSMFASMVASLVLTEALSLFFLVLTFISLYHYLKIETSKRFVWLFLTTTFMGFCLITRFYLMAVFGTIGLVLLIEHLPKFNLKMALIQVLAIVFGLIPFFLLLYYWKGMVPPVFKIRYPQFTSELGLNFKRPVVTLAYIGIWISPLFILSNSFKSLFSIKNLQLIILFLLASFFLISNDIYLWNLTEKETIGTGFIDFLMSKSYKINKIFGFTLNALLMSLGLFFGSLFLKLISTNIINLDLFSFVKSAFKIEVMLFLFILFYILEQFFVSGNVPFYERYLVLIYPAMGYLAFQFVLKQEINFKIKIYIMVLIVISFINLWRI